MSVELRLNPGKDIECDWGVIEYSNPRPEYDEVGHLMLITAERAANLVAFGPVPYHGAVHRVSTADGERLFAHLEYGDRRWVWELFDTHWWDGEPPWHPSRLLIGKWPD